MTKIKLCGLSRPCDIEMVNALNPEYIGFVFTPKSKRYVSPEKASELKKLLSPGIKAAGVFVNAPQNEILELVHSGIIDIIQLHGAEDAAYIRQLRELTDAPIIQAFRMKTEADIFLAKQSSADYILLDSGAGTGMTFNWQLIQDVKRPYFLAGGLNPDNVRNAIQKLTPFAVDVSSGIETEGFKDKEKMTAFVTAVRKGENLL